MAIYSKTPKQLVVDLINQGNPQLPFLINETDFNFSLPEVITDPGNGHNTRIRIMAKPNTNYTGNLLVTYRRLDIARIFKNVTPFVQKWIANSGITSGNLIQLKDILPLFSDKYGFNFIPEDWNDKALTGYNGIRGDVFTITPVSSNLAFVGTLNARWDIGERTLESLLSVDQIPGRLFPGGNDFTVEGNHKYWMLPDTHDIDFTEQAAVLENGNLPNAAIGYGYSSYYTAQQAFITQVMSRVTPRPNARGITQFKIKSTVNNDWPKTDPTAGHTLVEGGMNGLNMSKIILPNASFPEANSEFFNRALVITFPADCVWATGRVFFHYNV